MSRPLLEIFEVGQYLAQGGDAALILAQFAIDAVVGVDPRQHPLQFGVALAPVFEFDVGGPLRGQRAVLLPAGVGAGQRHQDQRGRRQRQPVAGRPGEPTELRSVEVDLLGDHAAASGARRAAPTARTPAGSSTSASASDSSDSSRSSSSSS